MEISSVGIVGAGQMGSGIAHVFAVAGYDVLMTDVSRDALDKAIETIEHNMDRQVQRERISQADRDAALARITTTMTLTDLGKTDLVIEAATERETIKQAIFEDLVPHLQPHTILTSNTSSISITRLASRTDRPERFMGFHFMNPVPVMQLVELIRGIATNDETYRTLLANHPMGPLELADFIGLDTCLAIMNVLHDGLADTKYRPCPLLTKYVEAGWLGRKTQRGFYDYRGETPVPTR
jgi:3-hydroxybutyryl-CoA dehydrogenase